MCSQVGYSQVPLAAVQALASDAPANFSIFLPGRNGNEPVLYRQEGIELSQPDFNRLAAKGSLQSLYPIERSW